MVSRLVPKIVVLHGLFAGIAGLGGALAGPASPAVSAAPAPTTAQLGPWDGFPVDTSLFVSVRLDVLKGRAALIAPFAASLPAAEPIARVLTSAACAPALDRGVVNLGAVVARKDDQHTAAVEMVVLRGVTAKEFEACVKAYPGVKVSKVGDHYLVQRGADEVREIAVVDGAFVSAKRGGVGLRGAALDAFLKASRGKGFDRKKLVAIDTRSQLWGWAAVAEDEIETAWLTATLTDALAAKVSLKTASARKATALTSELSAALSAGGGQVSGFATVSATSDGEVVNVIIASNPTQVATMMSVLVAAVANANP